MQTSKTYDPSDDKDHIDLVMESIWMGNLSRKEIALMYGVHIDTINQWMARTKRPNQTSLDKIRKLHRLLYIRIRKVVSQDYHGLGKPRL